MSKVLKFIGKWVAIVAVCLVVIALADSRSTAKAAYNTGTDVGGWAIGTSISGIPNFVRNAADAYKANTTSDAEKAKAAADKAAKKVEDAG